MNTEQFQQLLNRMGVVRIGGTNYGQCPKCQPEELDCERFRLMVGAGSSYPLLCFCPCCCVAKPQTDDQRQVNRSFSRSVWAEFGAVDFAFTRMDQGEIRKVWEGVRVGGQSITDEMPDRAGDQELNYAYCTLLDSLELNERHRKWLAKRGLCPDHCYEIGYRSADGRVACDLNWKDIPGLVDGQWLTRKGALLIPSRDRSGLIGAIKQRLTDGGRSRMRLLGGGGVKAKQMIHHPVGFALNGNPLWITEGERKADAVSFHYSVPVLGLPGVGFASRSTECAIDAGCVVLALDRDAAGRRCRDQIGRTLAENQVRVSVAKWPDELKGIDDALAAGAKVTLEEWKDQGGELQGNYNLTPNQKSQPIKRKLRDDEVLGYIRAHGPILRNDIPCYQPLVSELIRRNKVRLTKTQQGQVVEVVDVDRT